MKKEYEIDEAMMGTEWNTEVDDDLSLFCEILQGLCDKANLNIKIVEITDSWNGAKFRHEYDYDVHIIPFNKALEIYYEKIKK